jgi:CRP-like cAMP-binding protein
MARTTGWLTRLLGADLSPCDLQEFLGICRPLRGRADQTLLRPDDDRALFVMHGSAKAHAATRDGDEVITALLGPGDSYGLSVALGSGEAGTEVSALEPVEALLIPGPNLRSLIPTHPGLTAACLEAIGRQHAAAAEERLKFAGTNVPDRVYLRLLELADRWGQPRDGYVEVLVPLTQEELAAWSGTSRESVSKVLHGLRDDRVVSTRRRSIRILDIDRLWELSRAHMPPNDFSVALARLA